MLGVGVDDMKKVLIVLSCLCLAGCHSIGSIAHDDLELTQVSKEIDQRIETGEWRMNVLQEPMEASLIEEVYGVPSTCYDEVMAKVSLLSTSDEIVLFHVVEGQEEKVQELMKAYQEACKQTNTPLKEQALIEEAELIQLEHYILYVCGEDHANVVQYISSLT